MKNIRVEKLKDIKKVLEKIFMEWDKHPDGFELVFTVDTRRESATARPTENEVVF
jgi:hypothetical protein